MVVRVTVEQAKLILEANGYVVLKQKSYENAQRRQWVDRALRASAEEDRDRQREWMERDVFPWKRHLMNRVTHLGNLAVRLGATTEDMKGPPCDCGRTGCEVADG